MSSGRTVIDIRQIVIRSVQLDEIEKYGETSLYVSRTQNILKEPIEIQVQSF